MGCGASCTAIDNVGLPPRQMTLELSVSVMRGFGASILSDMSKNLEEGLSSAMPGKIEINGRISNRETESGFLSCKYEIRVPMLVDVSGMIRERVPNPRTRAFLSAVGSLPNDSEVANRIQREVRDKIRSKIHGLFAHL
eukprot:CAMPEP_0177728134 /NCGR_PEP_ID=MMETSP0484_2-20121128/20713_1 /TAXON_ID=354590 /ORGANISM="Rhodomonas lens, Strain RHODO" /LENGTH=138 /DNA_ID=CAMNT_0019240875 /DNA_START=60 /DNA_END=472 /DNA_ORIENTATION=-